MLQIKKQQLQELTSQINEMTEEKEELLNKSTQELTDKVVYHLPMLINTCLGSSISGSREEAARARSSHQTARRGHQILEQTERSQQGDHF
jgi:hypothetical protein